MLLSARYRPSTWLDLEVLFGPALYRTALEYRPGRSVPTRSVGESKLGGLVQLAAEVPFGDVVVGIASVQYRAVGGVSLPSYGVRNDHDDGMVPFPGATIPLDHLLFAVGVGVGL